LRITFIGTGGPTVTEKRCCSCFLVDQDMLIDCGTGAVKNLRKANVNLTKIRKILISHFHVDHIGDLIPLLWALELDGYKEPIEIFGYVGIEKTVKTLLKTFNTPQDFTIFNLKFVQLKGKEKIGEIQTLLTKHKPKNLAYRIERNGKSLCYTGDTKFYRTVAKFALNCDVLIHDSVFLDEQENIAALTNHSTAGQAGKIARLARVKKLVLTHIFPGNDDFEDEYLRQAEKEFKGEVLVAKDLQTIEI